VVMPVMRELRRRLSAEQSLPRFDPCLPRSANQPPAGTGWLHEIKHDGFRIMAHRRDRSVRLVTRNGRDLTDRFPLVTAAIEGLPVKSCVIDGEAIVCNDSGLAVFNLIRGHGTNARAILCAFDLLEVNGEDIRAEPIDERKRRLAGLLRLPHEGIALNESYREDGATIFKHACALGCEGIVSKRLGSQYPRQPIGALAQDQEPERAGREARGRGRIGVTGGEYDPWRPKSRLSIQRFATSSKS
jgi:bifunctional non-homologous end joining protein LigD